jgi:hypothetical protein
MFFAGQFVEILASELNNPPKGFVLDMNVPSQNNLGSYLGRYYLYHHEDGGLSDGWLVQNEAIYHESLFPQVFWPWAQMGTNTYLTLHVKLKYGWELESVFFIY